MVTQNTLVKVAPAVICVDPVQRNLPPKNLQFASMELNHIRRVTSAGYRLPDRTSDTNGSPEDTGRLKSEPNNKTATPVDQVTRDRVWREMVWSERRTVQEWEKNWGFLRNFDHLGQPKAEDPLPATVPLFSNQVPNTSNQAFGSRLSTPLGSELIRLDRLLLGFGRQEEPDPGMES